MKKIILETITCPIERVAYLLCDRWTILIIRDLLTDKKRFSDLQRSLGEISTRTLTLKLGRLQKLGLLEHKNTFYFLSKKATKLQEIIDAMALYGKKYFKKKNQKYL